MNRRRRFLLRKPLDVPCAQPFSPSDVFRRWRTVLSFIFIFCGYRTAGRYWWVLFVLCSHFWRTSGVVSNNEFYYPERRGASRDRPTTTKMHEWWAQIIHYFLTATAKRAKKEIVFFSSCSFPSRLWCVNASTCTRFSGHSEAFKVNTSSTSSSRILSSIIKAESRGICIIPGIRGRPTSLQQSGPCRTNGADEVWGDDIQTCRTLGELQGNWYSI